MIPDKMKSEDLRQKFRDFFAKRGHAFVPSSSLIPDDPSVLLTTAGMQQFKPYYTGDADPMSSVHPTLGRPLGSHNAVSIQKSFRTSDIDEVGDERHLTFFEMMGNFSFGGYFKEEAIRYAFDFLTKEVGLKIEYVTIFEGKDGIGVPKDEESRKIWQLLGITDIREEGIEDVFWGPTGSSGPCGPTTEIYCKNGDGEDIEIWNIVFNEFLFNGSREELLSGSSDKKLEPLKTPGVDTGMGLERLAMCVQKKKDIFETDLFQFVRLLRGGNEEVTRSARIIADHLRGSVFLLADGVRPSNKGAGYALRRILRRLLVQWEKLSIPVERLEERILAIIEQYGEFYDELKKEQEKILEEFNIETAKFNNTLEKGLKEFYKQYPSLQAQAIVRGQGIKLHKVQRVSGKDAFYYYQTFGLTPEIIKDLARDGAHIFDEAEFNQEFQKHQEISRAGSIAKFGGHGLYMKTGEVTIRDESEVEKVTRLHTATHLLHSGLRAVLGSDVRQDGSDITVERTRFDFRFSRKATPEELKKTEEWVNDAIRRDLKVEWEEMPYEEAVQKGALGFFHEKYPPRVKVYSVFDASTGEIVSRELCGGPHVTHTGEIGQFRIIKEESSSAGVRRIRGALVGQ